MIHKEKRGFLLRGHKILAYLSCPCILRADCIGSLNNAINKIEFFHCKYTQVLVSNVNNYL